MKFRHALGCLLMTLALLSVAHAQKNTSIAISGSDTMLSLTQKFAEDYMKKHPNVQISVTGGGSGRGIADITEGLVEIAQASRKIKPEEIKKAQDNGYDPQEHVAALDAIAVAVHKDNPMKEVSLAQLRAIYTGAVKKWNEIDPSLPATDIVPYSREANCGTYDFFKERVLQKADFAKNTSYLAATAAIVNTVASDKNAIGFGGVAYFVHDKNIRVLAVKETKDKPAVLPVTADGSRVDFNVVQSGAYPISRPLQYYTREPAAGDVKNFLDWTMSAEGQKIVGEMDYIPLAPSDAK
ncbi:MAG TPA: PstS family phosphate ABC transporter substrate-binding protein [Candidatus Sumerlaeota bacterium]|nr:PstS family phosphate ABC transporter substrate-binding protein [Candidatus Sumerlaeota bacterium]